MHSVSRVEAVHTVITSDGFVYHLNPGSFRVANTQFSDMALDLQPDDVVVFEARTRGKYSSRDRVSLRVSDIRSIAESVE